MVIPINYLRIFITTGLFLVPVVNEVFNSDSSFIKAVGIAALFFIGLLLLIIVPRLIGKIPALVLGKKGIFDTSGWVTGPGHGRWHGWDEVKSIKLDTNLFTGQEFLYITLLNNHLIVIPQTVVKTPLVKIVNAVNRSGHCLKKVTITKSYKNRKFTFPEFLIVILISLAWFVILIGSIFIPQLLELKNAHEIGLVFMLVLLGGMFYLLFHYFPISFNPKLMRKNFS